MDTVEKDRVVTIVYSLRDEQGELVDASGPEGMGYLHGHDNIVKGLEKALDGHKVGEELEVEVSPEDGFGVFKEDAFFTVHRRELPPGTRIEVGSPFRAEGTEKATMLWITKVKGAQVTITPNHPMAGKTLRFDVRIGAVREATDEEIAHGHAHDGRHHH